MKNNVSPLTSHVLRVINVVGTKANFIKIAPIIRAIDKHNKSIDFLDLEMHTRFVITDSGGIQEETTASNIPCLTLRNATERPITLAQGTNTLVWNKKDKIIEEAMKILENGGRKENCPTLWDGKAAKRIVEIIEK